MQNTDVSSELQSLVEDPTAIVTGGVDIRGTVFVIPVDAPVPSELTGIELPSGSLYNRLAPMSGSVAVGESYGLVPLSGAELLALDRAWPLLVGVKKIAALFDIPGAKYDILFQQAVRQIGLRRVDWPSIGDQLANLERVLQRTRDTAPYLIKEEEERPKVERAPSRAGPRKPALASAPEGADDDASFT